MKATIWTYFYEPFHLGGNVWQAKGCEVEAEPADLGGGYSGYVVATPYGTTVVAEATSGAIVGNDLESVRKDIETGDPAIMRQQVEKAIVEAKGLQLLGQEEFWRILQKAK